MFFRDLKVFIGASTIAMVIGSGFQFTLPCLAIEKQINSGSQANQAEEPNSGLQDQWEQDINAPNAPEHNSAQVGDQPDHPLVAPRVSSYLQRPTLTPAQKPLPGTPVLTQTQPPKSVGHGAIVVKASFTANSEPSLVQDSHQLKAEQAALVQKQKLASQAQQAALKKQAQEQAAQFDALQKQQALAESEQKAKIKHQALEKQAQESALLAQQALAQATEKAKAKQQAIEKQAQERALLKQKALAQAEQKAKAKQQALEKQAQERVLLKQQAVAQAEQEAKARQDAREKQSQAQALWKQQRLEAQAQEKALREQKARAQAEQNAKAKQLALALEAQERALLKEQALTEATEKAKARQLALQKQEQESAIQHQQDLVRERQAQARQAEVLARKQQAQIVKDQEALAFQQQKLAQQQAEAHERESQRLAKRQAFELKEQARKAVQQAEPVAASVILPKKVLVVPLQVAVLNKPFPRPVKPLNSKSIKALPAFAKIQNSSQDRDRKQSQLNPFSTSLSNRPSDLYIARLAVPVAPKPSSSPATPVVPVATETSKPQPVSAIVAPDNAQQQVDRYVGLLANWLSAEKPESLEPVLVQGQSAVAAILGQQNNLSPQMLQTLGQQMQGYRFNSNPFGLTALPDAPYFVAQAHMHGTPVDVAFADLLQQTLSDNGPSIFGKTADAQNAGLNHCTRFGSHELVRLYGAWKSFQSAYPQAYRWALNDPNLPLLSHIEAQLLHSQSACGSPESVQDELQSFLAGYPDSELAPKLKKRLNNLRKKTDNMQFFQGDKKR